MQSNSNRKILTASQYLMLMLLITIVLLPVSYSMADDVVALDVGHSHHKPGATAHSGVPEFALNLTLAKDVRHHLNARHIETQLIGANGKMDILRNRTKAAAKNKLFVSLHHDSIPVAWMHHVEDFSGYSIFVSKKNPKLAKSLSCAKAVGMQLRKQGFFPSHYHALPIKGQNRPYADKALGVHYFDDLVVLKTAKQAALLIEAGVIVNPQDEHYITADSGRHRLAKAIANGIASCMQ